MIEYIYIYVEYTHTHTKDLIDSSVFPKLTFFVCEEFLSLNFFRDL